MYSLRYSTRKNVLTEVTARGCTDALPTELLPIFRGQVGLEPTTVCVCIRYSIQYESTKVQMDISGMPLK